MKRANQQYLTASNGLEALQKYQDASASIKVIFMGTSSPLSPPANRLLTVT